MAANYYKYKANMNDRTYFTSVITDTAGRAKRYFSNVESEIYFGDQEMDDLYQFEFGIDEKVLPIYGYNCYYASELVSGQRIVQGQFVVNYTDTMLIQNTLSKIDNSVYKESKTAEQYVPGGDFHHAIYDKEFDIMIGYGYYDVKDKQTYNATSQTILGAKITGMHKVMDTTGQPILEVFTFVAKNFIEENITQSTTGDNNKSDNKNNNVSTPSLKVSYVCSDAYNANEITKNETYVSKNTNCEHFINNLTYKDGMISLMVQSGNKKDLTLVSGSVEITDQLSKDITIPLLEFTSVSKTSAQIKMDNKYSNLFEKKKTKYGGKIKCTLKYKIKISDKSGTKKEFKVVHKDAIIYL